MVRVKVCGITTEEDARLCVEEGVDTVGFVVEYPVDVPWNLGRQRAAQIMRTVPPFVTRVAVVGGDARTLIEIATATQPHVLQLHRDEPEPTVQTLARELAGTGVQLVKVLRVDPETDAGMMGQHWRAMADRFVEAGASAILVDSRSRQRPAGTGRTVDWEIVRTIASDARYPVIVAGGLTPENVAKAIERVRPYAVDVISGVEDAAHRKVRERVRAFVRAVRESH